MNDFPLGKKTIYNFKIFAIVTWVRVWFAKSKFVQVSRDPSVLSIPIREMVIAGGRFVVW